MSRHLLGLPAARAQRRLVIALSGATLLLWVGGSAILPLLPNYLRRHGADPALVGVVMAAYFAASVATQYPVGRLSDRIGRRPVVLGGLVLFALGSLGFAGVSGAGPDIAFRALQGIGAGAVMVAAAATIGTEVDAAERGGAFGALYGSEMLALAIGPLVGSVAGVRFMGTLFVIAAGVALVAALPVLAIVPGGRGTLAGAEAGAAGGAGHPAPRSRGDRSRGDRPRTDQHSNNQRSGLRFDGPFTGVLLVFAVTGLLTGVYEACWTMLMTLRHATSTEIGLSWTLFALPFALLSVPAGRLANRFDRRLLALVSLASEAAFCALYPFLHLVAVLILCCTFEAIGAVVATPAALLVLTEAVSPSAQGEAQGSVETARTAATAVAAAAGGALFGARAPLPFVLAALLSLGACVAIAVAWRALPRSGVHGEPGSEPLPMAADAAGRALG